MGNSGTTDFDVVIRGGGPLACAIARDATGRGLRVLLSTEDDFGGDLRQHIVTCGLTLLPEFQTAPAEETSVMQRVCPQLKTVEDPNSVDIGTRFFKTKEPPKPNLPCASVANRFAILNARDASERGAKLFSKSKITIEKQGDTGWSVSVTTLDGKPLMSVTARVFIDTLPKLENATPQFARVASFKQSNPFDSFAKKRKDTIHFAFESGNNTIDVGLVSPEEITADDLVAHAHKQGIHGNPLWVSDCFSPTMQQSKLSISKAPTQFVVPDTAPSGWRKLAEDVVAEIAPFAQMIGKRWTAFATLPGGDFEPALRDFLLSDLQKSHPNIDMDAMDRLFSNYGTECDQIFGPDGDLGHHFGAGLFEAEVKWLVDQEWAQTAQDILWRRTLLGMQFTDDQQAGLTDWMTKAH